MTLGTLYTPLEAGHVQPPGLFVKYVRGAPARPSAARYEIRENGRNMAE